MDKEQILALALFHARDYLTFKLGGRKGCDIEEIVCDDEIYADIVNELASKFENFHHEAVAKFLETTSQYVTNDASREAAISAAIESYKAELLKEVGEPFGFYYEINGTWDAFVVGETEPDDDVYDEGSLKALFTSDQVAAAVLKATKPLEDQLTKVEQRVAEACAEWIKWRWGTALGYNIAEAIRSGEWRKFVKEV